jgi:hypothetical protein
MSPAGTEVCAKAGEAKDANKINQTLIIRVDPTAKMRRPYGGCAETLS